MIQDRYALINNQRIEFEEVKKDDIFSLSESDGTLVMGGKKYIALSDAYKNKDGVWSIDCDPAN